MISAHLLTGVVLALTAAAVPVLTTHGTDQEMHHLTARSPDASISYTEKVAKPATMQLQARSFPGKPHPYSSLAASMASFLGKVVEADEEDVQRNREARAAIEGRWRQIAEARFRAEESKRAQGPLHSVTQWMAGKGKSAGGSSSHHQSSSSTRRTSSKKPGQSHHHRRSVAADAKPETVRLQARADPPVSRGKTHLEKLVESKAEENAVNAAKHKAIVEAESKARAGSPEKTHLEKLLESKTEEYAAFAAKRKARVEAGRKTYIENLRDRKAEEDALFEAKREAGFESRRQFLKEHRGKSSLSDTGSSPERPEPAKVLDADAGKDKGFVFSATGSRRHHLSRTLAKKRGPAFRRGG